MNNDKKVDNKGKEVDIELSLNNVDDTVMSDLHKEMLKDELSNLPPLKIGEVSINGVYTYDMGDKLEVSVYVRNGFSKQISLDIMPLVITNKKGDVLAKQTIDMKELGIIPSMGGRPYKVYFDKKNVFVEKIQEDDWNIKFEKEIKALKTVNVELEELPKNLSFEMREYIMNHIKSLSLVKKGDVSLSTITFSKKRNGSISIVLMVRNGTDKKIKIEKLPISIKDNENNFVGGGLFEIDNIEVNPGKAKVYDFVLKPEKIVNKDADLSKCKVYFTR
ncbi:hypothetical protein CLTEP_13200 [Clostridium tepidiprofundi DSM 19306]|uniref:SLAP domain-containing protein n=1 Tax=Clostridium tepidiprofundi DSM 19306 TaxID=1121338 RepID=A0A151B4J8_9CLOT|nr:SLAP domain-containing protein [Clostridium tepidiprofundi]KYH34723.1 hypothetical protein CLTEP_13200 [Clostridium tepidiprofundi DSM 19306]